MNQIFHLSSCIFDFNIAAQMCLTVSPIDAVDRRMNILFEFSDGQSKISVQFYGCLQCEIPHFILHKILLVFLCTQ